MILAAAALVAVITGQDIVRLEGDQIRLGQVVELTSASASLGKVVIARLPDGSARIELTRAQLASLAVRAVPGLAVETGQGSVSFIRAEHMRRPGPACFEAAVPVVAGAPITRSDAIRTGCDDTRMAARLRFDPSSRSALAAGPVAVGDYLGAVRLGDAPTVRRGDLLTLRSRSGPVTIERSVIAMQPAHTPDRKVFVKDEDGQVFAGPLGLEKGQ